MSDFDAGSPAAEAVVAPADNASTPNPISTEREPVADKPDAGKEPAKAPTAREALERAAAKVDADKSDAPKPVKSDGPTRSEDGKFSPKDGAKPVEGKDAAKPVDAKAEGKPDASRPDAAAKAVTPQEGDRTADPAPKPAAGSGEAPARFSADAKAAWAAAPEPVKAEVTRMEREMTAGIEKYRADAEAFEPVRKYHDMAKAGGNSLDKVLELYVGLEQEIDRNPIGAMERIAELKGFSMRQVAEHFLGQPADQQAAQRDSENSGAQARDRRPQVAARPGDWHDRATEDGPHQCRRRRLRVEASAVRRTGEGYRLFHRKRPDVRPGRSLFTGRAVEPRASPCIRAEAGAGNVRGSYPQGRKVNHRSAFPGSDPVTRQPSSSIGEALRRAAGKVV